MHAYADKTATSIIWIKKSTSINFALGGDNTSRLSLVTLSNREIYGDERPSRRRVFFSFCLLEDKRWTRYGADGRGVFVTCQGTEKKTSKYF